METLQHQPESATEHYPGIEEYFVANEDWLSELGFQTTDALNALVDDQHASYVDRIQQIKELDPKNPIEVSYPTAESYTEKFLSQMATREDNYREIASKKKAERETLGKIYNEDRPIRMQRVEATRKKTEQIADVFTTLDIDSIDPSLTNAEYYVYPYARILENGGCGTLLRAINKPEDKYRQGTSIENAVRTVSESRNGYLFHMAEPATGGLLAYRDDIFDTDFLNTSALSVGEYGVEATQRIAQTISAVGEFLKDNEAYYSNLDEEFGHTLVRSMDNIEDESVPMLSLYEGVMTIGQALNTLMQEKIEGYDDAEDLIEDIVSQGVLLKFAKTFATTGQIGPLNLAGKHIPELVGVVEKPSAGRRLKLNDEYLDEQADHKKAVLIRKSGQIAMSILNGEKEDTSRPTDTMMALEGCPASHSSYNKKTGESRNVVQEMTRIFMDVYRKVEIPKLGSVEVVA